MVVGTHQLARLDPGVVRAHLLVSYCCILWFLGCAFSILTTDTGVRGGMTVLFGGADRSLYMSTALGCDCPHEVVTNALSGVMVGFINGFFAASDGCLSGGYAGSTGKLTSRSSTLNECMQLSTLNSRLSNQRPRRVFP